MTTRDAVATTLLAAAAGVVDLWGVVSLGAFAGVVTGNLVLAAGRLATGDLGEVVPAALAVAGFVLGGVLAALAGRTCARPAVLLGVEAVLLGVLAGVWVAVPAAGPAVLGGAAVAMGAQSVLALRLGESTTYMTGTVTAVLRDVATGGVLRRLSGLRVVGALVVGAGVAGVLLAVAPPVVPGLAALLVALAAVVHAWHRPAPHREEAYHDRPTRRS